MIRRLYVHNFRCLENFELPVSDKSSVLLIGKNGSGKTTVGFALEVLQKIARGTNRVGDLVKPKDFSRGRSDVPMRFEIEVELAGTTYKYVVAFELPDGFKELRVFDEQFAVDGTPVYNREVAQVHLARTGKDKEAKFLIDWHVVALPIVQEQSTADPLFIFKQWLSRMLILRPVPSLMMSESKQETLFPRTVSAVSGTSRRYTACEKARARAGSFSIQQVEGSRCGRLGLCVLNARGVAQGWGEQAISRRAETSNMAFLVSRTTGDGCS